MTAIDDATRLLEQLGQTRSEVARSLRKAGIRGYRDSRYQCPVARWLGAHHITCRVGKETVRYGNEAGAMPAAVIAFIAAFDGDEIARDLVAP